MGDFNYKAPQIFFIDDGRRQAAATENVRREPLHTSANDDDADDDVLVKTNTIWSLRD